MDSLWTFSSVPLFRVMRKRHQPLTHLGLHTRWMQHHFILPLHRQIDALWHDFQLLSYFPPRHRETHFRYKFDALQLTPFIRIRLAVASIHILRALDNLARVYLRICYRLLASCAAGRCNCASSVGDNHRPFHIQRKHQSVLWTI